MVVRSWKWVWVCLCLALLQACGGGDAPSGRSASPDTVASDDDRKSVLAYQAALGFDPQVDQTDERIATISPFGLAGAFMPDGRLLTLSQRGVVGLADVGTGVFTSLFTIPNVYSTGEKGALDIELDPNFASNKFFYVYYSSGTVNTDTRLRIARFTFGSSPTAIAASQIIIWSNPGTLSTADYHIGGSLKVGNDGKFYLTVGDGTVANNSQLLNTVHGKILRLNLDGTVPTDNPFNSVSGALPEIYAYGLRNTFRISVDRPTGTIWMGDVGGNVDTTAYEEVNILKPGANYGWPLCEGPLGPPKAGPNCPAGITPPIHYYPHVVGGACCFNRSVSGGFVYRGSKYPAAMQGIYLHGDYAGGFIEWLKPSADLNVRVSGGNFLPSNVPAGITPVWFGTGNDGYVYYISFGWAGSELRRIRYTGVVTNQPPRIVSATATPTSGATPLNVQFQGQASDPEGDAITYSWNFGDGSPADNTPSPSHLYSTAGSYTARLTVTAGGASVTSNAITITVGTPPTATITSPPDGTLFAAGQTITINGQGTSPDFGNLTGAALSWQILFAHNDHTHPGASGTGSTISLPIDTTGHGYEGNTRYLVYLTATDPAGRTGTAQITLLPRKVQVTLATNLPSGGAVTVDGVTQNLPFVVDTIQGFLHEFSVPATACVSGTLWNFGSWSEGGSRTHSYTVPPANTTLTANYTDSGTACSTGPQGYLASGGMVVFEAEGFDGNTAMGGKTWTSTAGPGGASGSYMLAGSNTGALVTANVPTSSPRLDYRVFFESAGTYTVWLRSNAPNDLDNSIHIGIDGAAQSTVTLKTYNSPLWSKAREGSTAFATVTVPSGGLHTFNVWMREDGYPIDKFILTNSSSYVPSGTGPAVSARGSITVSDTTAPTVVAVSPIAAATGLSLTVAPAVSFSEAVSNTAGISLAPSAGGAAVAATLATNGNIVTLTPNAPLAASTSYRLTVPTTVTDLAGNPLASAFTSTFTTGAGATTPSAYMASGGMVVFEAEGFDGNTPMGGKTWSSTAGPGGASGSYMLAGSNTGVNLTGNPTTSSPRLDYRVNFESAGTYTVWLRSNAPNDLDNSIYVGINGASQSTVTIKTYNSPLWSKAREGSTAFATVTVLSAGVHTFNVWMREDGYPIDKFVLTTSTSYVPTGTGPAVSARGGATTAGTASPTVVAAAAPAAAFTAPAINTAGNALAPANLAVSTSVAELAKNLLSNFVATATVTVSGGGSAAPLAYTESGGMVVFEAEGFDANKPVGNKAWAVQNGMMVAVPNTETTVTANVATLSPRLDYRVRFASAGTYRGWVRARAASDLDNSIYVGLDGVEQTTATLKTYGSLLWTNAREGSATPVTITVPTPGVHTVNIWMREDGFPIDRMLLTSSASYVPSGAGPAVSARK